jgi:hypothetical protein
MKLVEPSLIGLFLRLSFCPERGSGGGVLAVAVVDVEDFAAGAVVLFGWPLHADAWLAITDAG